MNSFARLRPSQLLGQLPTRRVVLSLVVLSLVVGVLAPSATAFAAAHVPPARTHLERSPRFFSSRTLIDSSVQFFHFFSSTEAMVLGTNGNLWLEQGPFGTVPPQRIQLDFGTASFQAISDTQFLDLDSGVLSLTYLDIASHPYSLSSTIVDDNVQAYQWLSYIGLSAFEILVLGDDGKLWLEQGPVSPVPPDRVQVDGNVASFQFLDLNTILVKGTDNKLWLEQGPFRSRPSDSSTNRCERGRLSTVVLDADCGQGQQ